jgi:hypothetical protein
MPYERSESKLEDLIAQALRSTEIQTAAEQANLRRDDLVTILKNRPGQVWETAASEIEAYDQLENAYKAQLSETRRPPTGVNQGESSSNLIESEQKLTQAEEKIEQAIIEKALLPELRSAINFALPSYETYLTISNAPGLAEVFEPEFIIPTEAQAELSRLLNSMPGGSIGITGPRGAGKTTLIESACGQASAVELKGRPVLSVMTTPQLVDFDAREYILYVFSSVCQRALELKATVAQEPWDYVDDLQRPFSRFLPRDAGWREVLVAGLIGVLLIVSSLLTTILISESSAVFLNLGIFVVLLGLAVLLTHVTASLAGLLKWGLAPTQPQSQLEGQYAEGSYQGDVLVAAATRWLLELRFQQSYSSSRTGGISGTVSPIQVQAQVAYSVSLAKKELSLPEIARGYRDFLELARVEYEIAIGIDDLDKIDSDEEAKRFLKKIRALFGLESCFYLISVSETALGNQEGSSLFRGEVESALDEIVYVDYFSLDSAQRFLRRRVIGVPVPFLDFCYCMAGGLPRGLVRTLRSLFEEVQANPDRNSLSALCASLVRSDLKGMLRTASVVAGREVVEEWHATQLFRGIRKLESLLDEPEYFPKNHPALLESYEEFLLISQGWRSDQQAEPSEVVASREKIASISTELGVYLYFLATLLEIFASEPLNEDTLRTAEDSGALDRLARARQYFTSSLSTAESAIREFRREFHMRV